MESTGMAAGSASSSISSSVRSFEPSLNRSISMYARTILSSSSTFLFHPDERPVRAQEIAVHIREIQHQPPRFTVIPRDGSIQRVERIEQEVGIDLGLQRPQLGLRNQI